MAQASSWHFVTTSYRSVRAANLLTALGCNRSNFPHDSCRTSNGRDAHALGVPTGPMRAPGSNALAFAFQSFIDEFAFAAGRDAVQFRLDLLGPPRVYAASQVRMGRRRTSIPGACARCLNGLPSGQAGGSARSSSIRPRRGLLLQPFGLFRRGRAGERRCARQCRVDKVWVAADIGSQVINPMGAENQVQGAAIDGISAALGQAITIERGRAVQRNFDDLSAVAHRPCPARGCAFRDFRQSTDRSRRAGAAAGHSGLMQCHFCRDRQAHPQAADRPGRTVRGLTTRFAAKMGAFGANHHLR